MLQDKIPVLLLTGYLGSGKTTLLNRILSNRKGIRFAVIVNDIGEVNIDAELIQKGGVVAKQDDSLVALQNGCICCSLKMDLVQQLRDLCSAKEQASHDSTPSQRNAFDYIVIEASGICEPAPIAQTIASYTSMVPASTAPIPFLDAIVTVVDALRLKDEFMAQLSPVVDNQLPIADKNDLASLVIEQIEFCNLILLNKVSEVNEKEREHISAILRAIQPKAKILDCDYCDVPFTEILDTELFDFEKVATSAAWIQGVEGEVEEHHHHHEEHHHEHHHECSDPNCHCHDHEHECDNPHCHCHNHSDEYGISTFVYYRREPFDLNRFDEFVARHWDKGIIRCKGMCYFKEEYDMCYLFEQAGKQFNLKQAGTFYATMPNEELMLMMAQDPLLQRDWDEHYGDRMQKLVFIGQNMDKKAICQALDNCIV